MIQVTDLHKSFLDKNGDRLVILNGASFSIANGEMVSIIGASGTGKSTLLHLLGGLDLPDSGKIHIDGQELSGLKGDALATFRNKKVGFVFQFHHLLPEFTALENAAMPAMIMGMSQKKATELAAEYLNMVGLSHRTTHRPAELSGGEQQRVAIARALINKPSVLLADEPTGNLDQKNAEIILDLFFDVQAKTGITLVLVTHDSQIAAKTNRVMELIDGNLS
ncbi:ABC transporter ATP-binding protein [bacterium]|nr:MAG: ABC transporter ATP-binding protein [bacterium]